MQKITLSIIIQLTILSCAPSVTPVTPKNSALILCLKISENNGI